jgi:hypothetical protein
VVYPPGAGGDLLISIIDKHYLRTGCEYYGINESGRVMIYTSDYKSVSLTLQQGKRVIFNDQWFYDFSTQLGNRNLTYSMLDQVIIGCHLHQPNEISYILDNFNNAKIINIYAADRHGEFIIEQMRNTKLNTDDVVVTELSEIQNFQLNPALVSNDRVLTIPFGCLYSNESYSKYYELVRKFLGLSHPLICFDFVDFYLSRQSKVIQNYLQHYSQLF